MRLSINLTLIPAEAAPHEWLDGRPLLAFRAADYSMASFELKKLYSQLYFDMRWSVVRWDEGEWVVSDTQVESVGIDFHEVNGGRDAFLPEQIDWLAELPCNLEKCHVILPPHTAPEDAADGD